MPSARNGGDETAKRTFAQVVTMTRKGSDEIAQYSQVVCQVGYGELHVAASLSAVLLFPFLSYSPICQSSWCELILCKRCVYTSLSLKTIRKNLLKRGICFNALRRWFG